MPMIRSFDDRDSACFTGINFSPDDSGIGNAVDFAVLSIKEGSQLIVLTLDEDEIEIPVYNEDAHLLSREELTQRVCQVLVLAGTEIMENESKRRRRKSQNAVQLHTKKTPRVKR